MAAGAGLMRLTRGPRRRLKPDGAVVRTPEEARIWSNFRAFKAGITGEKGEASVREALEALRVPALHDVILRDGRGLTQIDHVVRAPDAVLVLETKRYAGIVSGAIDGRAWVQRFDESAERFTLPNPLRQNYQHRRAVEELIADRAVLVRTHVVAAGSAVFEGELADTIVPVTALASLLGGTPPVSQRWLDAAWCKLQMAAERSLQLREAHRQQVERRPG
ncbi:nuclease-related domain-containing protein [Roseomonas sp. E05]|uniref:nuclease-related domain-containing protein n=1 Tax=Roseomonas sp. E05 TaxID=3046310 RepID=UPI0024B9E2D8|nr:nuclease-related domain-containing protein [Roseomonas sp. E05]MDJ0390187.1 nuclease-related domain-containing protein [Roseomonas sp. E05]